jgi:hypothetical protein
MISLICVLPNVGVVRQSLLVNNMSHGSVVTTISKTLHGHSTTTYKKWIQNSRLEGGSGTLGWRNSRLEGGSGTRREGKHSLTREPLSHTEVKY